MLVNIKGTAVMHHKKVGSRVLGVTETIDTRSKITIIGPTKCIHDESNTALSTCIIVQG